MLTDTKVSKIRKAFPNSSLVNVKVLKIQLPKVKQSGGFLIGPLDVVNKEN